MTDEEYDNFLLSNSDKNSNFDNNEPIKQFDLAFKFLEERVRQPTQGDDQVDTLL